MACSKVRYAYCGRCGKVDPKHFDRGSVPAGTRTPEKERRALRAEFFAKKGKHSQAPAWRRLDA